MLYFVVIDCFLHSFGTRYASKSYAIIMFGEFLHNFDTRYTSKSYALIMFGIIFMNDHRNCLLVKWTNISKGGKLKVIYIFNLFLKSSQYFKLTRHFELNRRLKYV